MRARRHVASYGLGVDSQRARQQPDEGNDRGLHNWMALERIKLTVSTDNQPAMALYRKFGFETEGTSHRHAMHDGVLIDAILMARFCSAL